MKLRNKKTGEIGYTAVLRSKAIVVMDENAIQLGSYTSLAQLNSEWEDAPKEPKGIQCIYYVNHFDRAKIDGVIVGFGSKEEAEKAVEKLKALANLRKRGLKFNGWDSADRGLVGEFEIYCDAVNLDGIEQELELVFGREEV